MKHPRKSDNGKRRGRALSPLVRVSQPSPFTGHLATLPSIQALHTPHVSNSGDVVLPVTLRGWEESFTPPCADLGQQIDSKEYARRTSTADSFCEGVGDTQSTFTCLCSCSITPAGFSAHHCSRVRCSWWDTYNGRTMSAVGVLTDRQERYGTTGGDPGGSGGRPSGRRPKRLRQGAGALRF